MGEEIVSFRPSGEHGWTARAQCAREGAPNMFPHDQDREGRRAAVTTCLGCPVRVECLTEAIERGEQFGVWGGLTPDERGTFRRRVMRAANNDGHRRATRAEFTATAERAVTEQTEQLLADVVALDIASEVTELGEAV